MIKKSCSKLICSKSSCCSVIFLLNIRGQTREAKNCSKLKIVIVVIMPTLAFKHLGTFYLLEVKYIGAEIFFLGTVDVSRVPTKKSVLVLNT